MGRKIQQAVPPGGAVFSLAGFPRAYFSRTVIEGNDSALGEKLLDGIYGAIYDYRFHTQAYVLHTRPIRTTKIRIVEQRSDKAEMWSADEVRIWNGQTQLTREPAWLLTAFPNHWDVGLAFDNNPVTRWRTWEPYRSGMYIEIDFPNPKELDAVEIESADSSGNGQLRLDSWNGVRWDAMPVTKEVRTVEPSRNLGRAAIAWLQTNNISWLLTYENDFAAKEIARDYSLWGMELAVIYRGYRLYHISP
jgi:hypothetical protein